MIPFIDLKAQQARLKDGIDAAIARVLDHGAYIMGPEVAAFEKKLEAFCGATHALGCGNGTDAISLVCMAESIGPGDAVFVPSFTFIATAEAPAQLGATPFFVDVLEDTFNIDPDNLKNAIQQAKAQGLKPRAVIAVDMFGLPADYDALQDICQNEGLLLVADAAQSFGGTYKGRSVGTLADYTTTSFFPAKPLGCYGDGGAVFVEDAEKAALIKSLRVHGKGGDKYDNVRVGMNSRLDTIQAAILIEKLSIFTDELAQRQRVADQYAEKLGHVLTCPSLPEGLTSAWAQYTLKADNREALQAALTDAGVPSVVYYPIPLHLQTGYKDFPRCADLSVSEVLAKQVFSLPMSPYLTADDQSLVCAEISKLIS
ncbi:DegT/DnrJ/EryC1/StrS family aminotransferase [Terasakiella pusilla]|uniref:DegT/DnrJ/EryC1/StrS family aminotransferase n=1 Tax=Terasakiella pusilla TaxID=64973 RepID=UPI003AA9C4A3